MEIDPRKIRCNYNWCLIEKFGRPRESSLIALPDDREFEFDLKVEGVVYRCGPVREFVRTLPLYVDEKQRKEVERLRRAGTPEKADRKERAFRFNASILAEVRHGKPLFNPGDRVLYSEASEIDLGLKHPESGRKLVAVFVPNVKMLILNGD